MRLAAAFLIPSLLAAQGLTDLPWQAVDPSPAMPVPALKPSEGSVAVHLAADGTLRVFEGKGLRRLRMGLAGRPVKVWRDGGIALANFLQTMTFPSDTPLRRGLGSLPLDAPDFRPVLTGLLWILDDSERVLTLLHPSTCQVVRLRLPDVEEPELRFLADRLELHSGDGRAWSLPWIALLPQLLRLGRPAKRAPLGTAFDPYPKG